MPAPCLLPKGSRLVGRYRILQPIGYGGFATVYQARDCAQKNRLIALKQIHLETLGPQARLDATNMYYCEITHLFALRHKSLPHIYTSFLYDQHWYIVMEYLAGQTLEEYLLSLRRGFLSVKQVLQIGLKLCDALSYLHTQRPPIIFRDIKPANIIITRGGRICLIDFGIARLYRPGWKDTNPLGTPGYAAPEQYGRHASTTPQTDIYGLGATLQTLLLGKEPLDLLQSGIPPRQARAIPQDLQHLLTRMLEKEARQRPRDISEVKQALLAIREQRLEYKIKAAGVFLWTLYKERATLSGFFLFLLLFLDFLSITGLIWQLIWPVSLLCLAVFAFIRSIVALQQARAESIQKLSTRDTILLIWKQLTGSLPFACGFCFFLSYLFQNSQDPFYNPFPDLVVLGVVAGGCIIASLTWLIRRVLSRRATQHVALQQTSPKLEKLLVQTVRNRSRS